MKNRKVIVTAFLLVAIMILGVGYAAVNNVLDITGTGTVNQSAAEEAFNLDVYFDGVKNGDEDTYTVQYTDANGLYTARVNDDNNDKASFTVSGLKGAGESASITYRVVNVGDLNAIVTLKSCTNSNETYFDVKYYVNGSSTPLDLTAGTSMGTIAHTDGTMTITVVVTLKTTPTDSQSLTTTFEFNAEGVQPTP